jgi:Na+-transporting NADH:ubiquinone oxidoreductase subunit NqrF
VQVIVRGLASGRDYPVSYDQADLKTDLLHFLRGKGVTIASSCDGEGVCKKCVIQNGWLTCELTLEEFLKRQSDGVIEVAYL